MPEVIGTSESESKFRNILVPVDVSYGAYRGFNHAMDLAIETHSIIHLLHVIDEHVKGRTAALSSQELTLEKCEDQVRHLMEKFESEAESVGVEMMTEYVRGVPYEEIKDYAEINNIDLIVMGMHGSGREGWPHVGKTTDKVIESVGVTVLPVW